MFLTRCPRLIPVLWTIINTFVEERTREKFAVLKTDELIEYIDEINIPDFLGGQMPVCYFILYNYQTIFKKPTDVIHFTFVIKKNEMNVRILNYCFEV